MKIIQLVKSGLLILECIRIMILIYVLFSRNDLDLTAKIIYSAPGALFPLMALFIWLDTIRYRAYLPLFAAGKCIGIFIFLLWFIISKQVTIMGSFILSGDLFALAAVLLIIRDNREKTKIQTIKGSITGG